MADPSTADPGTRAVPAPTPEAGRRDAADAGREGGPVGPLRVAVHNGAPIWGGAEIATARLVAGLRRRGHDVLLYCNDPEVARRAAELDAPTRRLHLGGDVAVHHAVRFAIALRRRRPDVLVLGTFRKLWLGALAARLARVPRVVARIGLETDMPRNAKYRFVFRRWIDAVVFNADGMRRRFLDVLPGFEGDAVTIHTGVPAPEVAGGGGLRAELGIPASSPVVGSVGRLATQKRYDRLVRALTSLPGAHLLVVGEGGERERLEALGSELGVADRVHLIGHREDVGPALDAMDVFVISSDREGMSNAMLEAIAAGLPVVSTAVSGAREALRPLADGSSPGCVVGFEPMELAAALRDVLGDRGRLAAMAAAARRVARDRFDQERMLDAWEDALRGSRA